MLAAYIGTSVVGLGVLTPQGDVGLALVMCVFAVLGAPLFALWYGRRGLRFNPVLAGIGTAILAHVGWVLVLGLLQRLDAQSR